MEIAELSRFIFRLQTDLPVDLLVNFAFGEDLSAVFHILSGLPVEGHKFLEK